MRVGECVRGGERGVGEGRGEGEERVGQGVRSVERGESEGREGRGGSGRVGLTLRGNRVPLQTGSRGRWGTPWSRTLSR